MKCAWHCCNKETTKFHVTKRREALKKMSVAYKGGKCTVCGYDKSIWAMQFHHRDRQLKEFTVSHGNTPSWAKVQKELDKCDLVCSNCHAEIEEMLHKIKVDNHGNL
jgi:hypothetical protein